MKIKFILIAVFCVMILAISHSISYSDSSGCYPVVGCFPQPDLSNVWSGDIHVYYGAMQNLFSEINSGQAKLNTDGTFTGVVTYTKWSLYIERNIATQLICSNGTRYTLKTKCTNGAIDYPTCSACASVSVMSNNQCTCKNGASDPQTCVSCPAGNTMVNGVCGCANAANNPPACNVCATGSNMVNGMCTCSNGGIPQSSCTQCPTGNVMVNNQCVPGCTLTNVCGQEVQGVMTGGSCQTVDGSNANSSCIANFTVSSNTVNPNGTVDFSWSIPDLPRNITSKCGFVDLTTPTPRPIPGLQNLDPTVNSARISNIQATTRFCLICQFYSLLNNSSTAADNTSLGNAAVHQWVRVVRIGEQ